MEFEGEIGMKLHEEAGVEKRGQRLVLCVEKCISALLSCEIMCSLNFLAFCMIFM